VLGDFTRPLSLPSTASARARVGFFPGSTLGNFEADEAARLLGDVRALVGEGGLFVVGIDLVKPVELLQAAYDDAQGVTGAFNLNLLARINRELGGTFDLDAFAHRAVWNAARQRIEMHLESLKAQSVQVGAATIGFAAGETIHTENCHKYSMEGFAAMAAAAGWRVLDHWTAPSPSFAVVLLQA
jgi:dimethylhistidine N-methyltransferase